MYSVKEINDFIAQMPENNDDIIAATLLVLFRTGKASSANIDHVCYDLCILKVTNLEFWEQTHNLT